MTITKDDALGIIDEGILSIDELALVEKGFITVNQMKTNLKA